MWPGRRRVTLLSVAVVAAVYLASAAVFDRREIAAQSSGITPSTTAAARLDRAALMNVVRELASPRYEGRRMGTDGARAAREYITSAFKAMGLAPASPAGYEQPFQPRSNVGAANVVGRIPGTDPAAKAIVLTAHYDHLGIRNGQLHPGADDNASGVAALLAIAGYVKAHPLRRALIVAAFDGEEVGLEGARAFVAHPPVALAGLAINVNLDMISRNDRSELFAAGSYHYPWLVPIIADVQRRTAVRILLGHDRPMGAAGAVDDWTTQSDHAAFHQAGVPFLYFGVEDHPDYHQPSDTADKIDPVFFHQVAEMVLDVLLVLDARVDAGR